MITFRNVLISVLSLLLAGVCYGQQGNFPSGGGGITQVSSLPGTCTPGIAPNGTVQLTVAPYLIYICTATNTYFPVGAGLSTIGATMGSSATGTTLTTSEVRYITVPFACTLKGWHIMADAGTVTIKFAKINGGTALPTVASNSISTSGVSLASGTKIDSTTMTDFLSTSVLPNDTIGFFITAIATAKQVTVQLDCQ